MKKSILIAAAIAACISLNAQESAPLKLGVAGVTHGHLHQVKIRVDRGDFEVVGVSEDNDTYRKDNDLAGLVPQDRFYKSLEEMLDKTKPEVVVAYGSIKDHMDVVRACAPRGIHVMVEKPLCTTVKEAEVIRALAAKHNIKVLVNYETSWYASNTYVKNSIDSGRYGEIFRIDVYDGHYGPVELGCSKAFTDWLTDPVLNGGGALFDFGCYGANLATWIFGGKQPLSVSAVTHTHKPNIYPKVDDDATIQLDYGNATVQINASWCWPFQRKDMWVYGLEGSVYQMNETMVSEKNEGKGTTSFEAPALKAPYDDSFRLLKAVVRGEIELAPSDLHSLENNITVVKILDAARESAAKGKVVKLK